LAASIKAEGIRTARRSLRRLPHATSLFLFGGALLLVGAVSFCIPASRWRILSAAGRLLVTEEPPVDSADVIVVAIDAGGAGTLEAADLVHRGVAHEVAVFEDLPTPAANEFRRRGLPYDDREAVSANQLRLLGVESVERIPRSPSGSELEGEILPAWCDDQGYHSVVLVTSRDHSRRLRRILRRSLRSSRVKISIQTSPYSEFNPDAWWQTRNGVRIEIVELEKLTLDVILHPMS
jgi:hypothetical protein